MSAQSPAPANGTSTAIGTRSRDASTALRKVSATSRVLGSVPAPTIAPPTVEYRLADPSATATTAPVPSCRPCSSTAAQNPRHFAGRREFETAGRGREEESPYV